MANKYVTSITVSNGLVVGVTGQTIPLADLPLLPETQQVLADVLTGNVSVARHGYAPKLPGDATRFLDGTGNYTIPSGGGGGSGFTPPNDALFAWVNQGGATTTTVNSTVVLKAPASATKNNRIRIKSAPATPYTVTTYWRLVANPSNFWNGGILFRESGTGRLHALSITYVNGLIVTSTKFDSPTVFDSDYLTVPFDQFQNGNQLFMRIADDGVNRICSYSADNLNYYPFHTVGRTDFLTADQVGFWANSENSNDVIMTLFHYLEG